MMTNENWRPLFESPLRTVAPDIARLLADQEERESRTVNLVASESYCPRATLEAEASILVNKNATGYPGKRAIGGSDVLDKIEGIAIERAKRLFGAEHANVQSLSSTIANVAVLRALIGKGDRILSFEMAAGGHVSHGGGAHVSGQDYRVETFGVDEDSGAINLSSARNQAERFRPRIIIAGSSSYPRRIDYRALHDIATNVGAILFADIAHVAGLVVSGLHPNPVPFADVVTTSTHKTLCGPRTGGVVLCQGRHAAAIDAALYPGLQGAPGAHIIAARAVLFDLVGRPAFHALMGTVVANATAFAESLLDAGMALYTGGTDTHMVVVDLRRTGWNGAILNARLARHGVTANATRLPALAGAGSQLGLRLGTVPMTLRGTDGDGFRRIGEVLARLLKVDPESDDDLEIAQIVKEIAKRHPLPDTLGS